MGVKGLLPGLQESAKASSVGYFKGTRVAIDASGWLHKGLYAAAEDYVDSGFSDSQFYVDYILARARSLREAGIEPILVFDGKRNNLKSETQAKREESRVSNMEQGRRLMDSMQATADSACRHKLRMEAISSFQKGLGVTHDMEINTISALKKLGIEVIISPYEADPQLAHLCQIGYCDSVLTEDSDILVYSAICGVPFNVFYKFDKAGSVQVINLEDVQIVGPDSNSDSTVPDISSGADACTSTGVDLSCGFDNDVFNMKGKMSKQERAAKEKEEKAFLPALKSFRGPSGRRMFAQLCILAGCDYSESVYGVGLMAAQRAIIKYKNSPDDERLEKVCAHFRSIGKKVPEEYLARVQRAEVLFHYHPVYNPITKKLEPFMPHDAASMYMRKSRAGHSSNAHSSISMSSSTKGVQSRTRLVDCNLGWRGPVISDSELAKLGSEAELLRTAPPGVSISDICEGKHSYKTFQPIHTAFPWDNPKHSKPILGKTGGSHWNIRRALMQATASLSQQGQGQIRSERQPVPLLRNQQPQFSSWNKGASYVQLPWHKPYSQQPKQQTAAATLGSLAVPILSRSPLSLAAERAGHMNKNTIYNLNDQSQMNTSHTRQTSGTQQHQQHQQQHQHQHQHQPKEHSLMASTFSLPPSVFIDCTADEKQAAPCIINLPPATDRCGSESRSPHRIDLQTILSTVPCADLTPVNALRCTTSTGAGGGAGAGRSLNPFKSPDTGDKLDFYGTHSESVTDGEAEESVLDLSSSPEESSQSSDEGVDGDSPSSTVDERESRRHVLPVSIVGGIAEGAKLGQSTDGGAAIMAECVSSLTLAPGLVPPSATQRSERASSGQVALLPLDINIDACFEAVENGCQVLNTVAALCPPRDSKRTVGHVGYPIQQRSVAEQKALSATCEVPLLGNWSDRGKENCSAAAAVNVNAEAHRIAGYSTRLDLKLQPHCLTTCIIDKENTPHGTGAGALTGLMQKTVTQGEKRKLYDTVAIVSDSRGGRGKRPKSSMRVASIKSFFAPR